MEIVKDILKVEEQKGYEEIETQIGTDIYLNQSQAEIENILWTDGKVEILSSKITQNKILVNGLVKFTIVYKSKEEELNICLAEENIDFKEEIYIDGIDETMKAEIKSNIEYIEQEILDEKKVSLKALVNIGARVDATNSVEIIKEATGKQGLETLKEKIKYNDVFRREESYAMIKEAFEVKEGQPPIDRILKVDLNPYEKELNITSDRLILSGILECSAIYFGDGKINSLTNEIPFTHFIDVDEIEYDAKCQLSMEVISGEYEIREDLDGQLKIIDIEAKIRVMAKLYNQKEKDIIIDAYSTSEKLELQTEEISLIENITEIVHREEISSKIDKWNFKDIYAVEGKPKSIDNQYVEDKIVVEGILSLNIYYMDDITEEITTVKEEVPFRFYINTEELGKNLIMHTDLTLESLKYSLREGILHIDAAIKSQIFVDRERKIKTVNDIEETDEIINKKTRPSIIVYIVQKEDQLWDIAKRYNTTVEEIIESNNIISPSNMMPGEKIIIEKKVDVNF